MKQQEEQRQYMMVSPELEEMLDDDLLSEADIDPVRPMCLVRFNDLELDLDLHSADVANGIIRCHASHTHAFDAVSNGTPRAIQLHLGDRKLDALEGHGMSVSILSLDDNGSVIEIRRS